MINPPLVDEQVTSFEVSPDGQQLVIRIGDVDFTRASIYSVDLSGATPGAPVKLSDTRPAGGWCWSADGACLAFTGYLDSPTTNEPCLSIAGRARR